MTPTVETRTAPPCAGCLGSRRCWACGGTGLLASPEGSRRDCTSCTGRGLCRICRPVPAQRQAP